MSLLIASQIIYQQSYLTWDEAIGGYSSDDYSLTLSVRKGSSAAVNLTITNNSDGSFKAVIPATLITEFGLYSYSAKLVDKSDETKAFIYEIGNVSVLPNIASAPDPRDDWRIIHDELIAKYKAMISAGQIYTEVSINGRVTKIDRAQLLKEIHNAATRAGIETAPNKFKVRFA